MIRRIEPGTRMSKAVAANGLVFTAGQVNSSSDDVADQTRAVLTQIDALLATAGTSKANLVSASIWLADISRFDEMNAVWDAWIDPAAPPARATVEARLANPAYLVEIAVVAALPA